MNTQQKAPAHDHILILYSSIENANQFIWTNIDGHIDDYTHFEFDDYTSVKWLKIIKNAFPVILKLMSFKS